MANLEVVEVTNPKDPEFKGLPYEVVAVWVDQDGHRVPLSLKKLRQIAPNSELFHKIKRKRRTSGDRSDKQEKPPAEAPKPKGWFSKMVKKVSRWMGQGRRAR